MLFDYLEYLIETLYDGLEGIILTLQRWIPLVLEALFILAPLILGIYLLCKHIGVIAGCVVAIILAVVVRIGFKEKGKSNKGIRRPFLRVYIIVLYVLTVPFFIWDMGWLVRNKDTRENKSEPQLSSQNTLSLSTTAEKEALFLKELEAAIAASYRGSHDVIIYESIDELKKINSQYVTPEIIKILGKRYTEPDSESVLMSQFCIKNLVEAKAKDSCKLLFYVQLHATSSAVKEKAKMAASQICKE